MKKQPVPLAFWGAESRRPPNLVLKNDFSQDRGGGFRQKLLRSHGEVHLVHAEKVLNRPAFKVERDERAVGDVFGGPRNRLLHLCDVRQLFRDAERRNEHHRELGVAQIFAQVAEKPRQPLVVRVGIGFVQSVRLALLPNQRVDRAHGAQLGSLEPKSRKRPHKSHKGCRMATCSRHMRSFQ
mmetsp:Transcript_11853/g.18875  ORF Transcript_11853/g.18875 Transcript_11853/m.18875 type:complete len:182 (-) Transcript_11853:89-634(-)